MSKQFKQFWKNNIALEEQELAMNEDEVIADLYHGKGDTRTLLREREELQREHEELESEKVTKSRNTRLTESELVQVRKTISDLQGRGEISSKIITALQKSNSKLSMRWKAERAYWTEVKRSNTKEIAKAGEVMDATEYKVLLSPNACETCKKKSQNGNKIFKNSDLQKSGYGHIPPFHPNCWLDHQVNIFTSKGWKHINKIKVNDLVLTHKGRFRKVTRLLGNKTYMREVVKIHFLKNSYATVTPEHPFLTDKGWKQAKDITTEDKLISLAQECLNCKKPFSVITNGYSLGNHKFCSKSCSSKLNTRIQWTKQDKDAIGKKIGISNLRAIAEGRKDVFNMTRNCQKGIREKIAKDGYLIPMGKRLFGDRNHSKNLSVRLKISLSKRGDKNPMRKYPDIAKANGLRHKEFYKKHPEKHPNAILARKGHMTGIERKMKEALERESIETFYNYPVSPYYVDFALKSHKIAIECDGEYWHKDKEKDLKRQKEIESKGWTVLRFAEKEIEKDVASCVGEIKRVLMNHNHEYKFVEISVTKAEKIPLKRPKRIYNFAVEEDESYVAKGIVSHNCYCLILPKD